MCVCMYVCMSKYKIQKIALFIFNIWITIKMHFNVYNAFYVLNSHQHVSIYIVAIFRVMMLLEEYECTYVINCVVITL